MRKIIMLMALLGCGAMLTGCETINHSHHQAASSSSSAKSSSSSSVKPDPNASERPWTYKNGVFDAGNETMRLKKYEIRPSANAGKKVLVIYCDITNNSTNKMDPSLFYMVVHAYQNNATSELTLNPGMVDLDANGNNPIQKYDDGLNNTLLPGKTVKAALVFELANDNPVRLTFENPDFDVIGSKIYKIKGKKLVLARGQKFKANASNQTTSANQPATQTNSVSQAASPTPQTNSSSSADGVVTAHPSQGGTIYQTGGDSNSFQGDPDTIATTQSLQTSIAKERGWE